MIQFDQSIADAYVLPARNVAMPSTPGRQVRFLQGHAVIKHGVDLVAMMKRPDVRIHITPYALSWVEQWLAAAKEVRAEVQWPEPPTPPVPDPEPVPEPQPEPDPVPASWDPSVRAEMQGAAGST